MPEEVARAGRARAGPPRAHGRVLRRVLDDPHLPGLADRRPVGEALRRAPRPRARARGPRRRPRRPRGRQGPDHRVHRRPPSARGARRRGRGPRRRSDPHPDRARPAPARPRSASRSRAPPDASSFACRWAASATRPRSAATGAPTSAPCPGRLIRALRDADTMNPVIMLDEVDKVGADWRGDPSAALLEVLDPAQNHSFRDHYLDVEVDLSQVLFIATANIAETIPAPLLDRMEVVRFDGYTTDEKTAIARGYLWPRQLQRNALEEDEVRDPRRADPHRHQRVHARGGRAQPRARARKDRCARPRQRSRRARPKHRSSSTSTRSARPSGANATSRRRPSAPPSRASQPASRSRAPAATCCSSRRPR